MPPAPGPPATRSAPPACPPSARRTAADRISSPLPDVTGRDRAAFAGRRVLVVGAGHSAANTLISLADLVKENPGPGFCGPSAEPPLRRSTAAAMPTGCPPRPARGPAPPACRGRIIQLHTGFGISALKTLDANVSVEAVDGRTLEADVVVPCTGFRPDLEILRELRLKPDPAVEAPTGLGPLIDPNFIPAEPCLRTVPKSSPTRSKTSISSA